MARQELINNKWIERETGKKSKPMPMGPPESFRIIKVIGRKYKLIKSKIIAMIRLAILIPQFIPKLDLVSLTPPHKSTQNQPIKQSDQRY